MRGPGAVLPAPPAVPAGAAPGSGVTYRPGRGLLLAAVLLAAAVSGCSAVATVYGRADWLVERYVDRLVTLDEAQEALLEEKLEALHAWHCRERLPDFVAWVREVRAQAEKGFGPAEVRFHYARARALWLDLMGRTAAAAAGLLETASDAQVAQLLEHLEERTREHVTEYVEPPLAQRVAARAERMEARLWRWIGDAEPVQRAAIAAWSRSVAGSAADWIASRRRRNEALGRVAALRGDGARLRAALTALLTAPEAHYPEALRRSLEAHRDRTLDLLARLAGTVTPEQREQVTSRLEELAGDLEAVRCPRPPGRST